MSGTHISTNPDVLDFVFKKYCREGKTRKEVAVELAEYLDRNKVSVHTVDKCLQKRGVRGNRRVG